VQEMKLSQNPQNTNKEYIFNRSLFIDTSNLEEIQKWNSTGVIDGVTSNQSIMLKDGVKPKDFNKLVKAICAEMKDKPVSIELSDSTASPKDMLIEAQKYAGLAENVVVKVPVIPETTKSLYVINELCKLDIALNITAIMTFEQMILTALAVRHSKKIAFLSLFWGRSIEDSASYRSRFDYMSKFPRVGLESEINAKPHNITKEIASFLNNGGYSNLKIIVGSIRTASMVGEAFAAGANICTINPDILTSMLYSQRTIETIKQFDDAWKKLQ
jgi:transaldolase